MEIMGGAGAGMAASNYINFNNVDFVTHDGLIFQNEKRIQSYQFLDRVEIVQSVIEGQRDELLFFLRLEGQNNPIIYDRTYITLQEVLANIGGLIKVLFLICKVLNSFYTQVAVKRDLLRKAFRFFVDFRDQNRIDNSQVIKILPKKGKLLNF